MLVYGGRGFLQFDSLYLNLSYIETIVFAKKIDILLIFEAGYVEQGILLLVI